MDKNMRIPKNKVHFVIIQMIFIFLGLVAVHTAWSLNIQEMANDKAEKNERKLAEITKQWFFDCTKYQMEDWNYRAPLGLKSYNLEDCGGASWWVWEDVIIDVLVNDYGIPENSSIIKNSKSGANTEWHEALHELLFSDIHEYYYMKYNFHEINKVERTDPKKIEVSIAYEIRALIGKNEDGINYAISPEKKDSLPFGADFAILTETEVSAVLSFISDFDKFTDEMYRQRSVELKSAIAQRKEKEVLHIKQIKIGSKPIENLDDAVIYYEAVKNQEIITNPPLQADHKNYLVEGGLFGVTGNLFIAEYKTLNDLHYFYFSIDENKMSKDNFRIGKKILIIGEFQGIKKYLTTMGVDRYAPVFVAKYIKHE